MEIEEPAKPDNEAEQGRDQAILDSNPALQAAIDHAMAHPELGTRRPRPQIKS